MGAFFRPLSVAASAAVAAPAVVALHQPSTAEAATEAAAKTTEERANYKG